MKSQQQATRSFYHLHAALIHILRPHQIHIQRSVFYSTYIERTIENIFRHSGNRVGLSSFLVFLNHLRIIIAFPAMSVIQNHPYEILNNAYTGVSSIKLYFDFGFGFVCFKI